MEEIAEKFAKESEESVEGLLERWDHRPDLLAEDIFRAKNLDTEEIEDLTLFRPYQPRIMHAYFYGQGKILNVYKGRRIGVSYTIAICILLEAFLKKDTFYPILSKTKSQSKSRISDIERLIRDAKIEIPTKKTNEDKIVLGNNSTIKAYTGDPDSARGDPAPKTVFIDEMAFLEDQRQTLDAYLPTISLGSAQMVQVSTPKAPNDEFLKANERGTRDGKNDYGILSLKQPTFHNADAIDETQSLYDQDVEAIRPDFDLMAAETQRASDPNGFAQEYLCRPVSDEYRFFSGQTIEQAMEKGSSEGYQYGIQAYNTPNSLIMGVDIGFNSDETAVAVFEHDGRRRHCRYHETIDDKTLSRAGITPASRQNPSAIAQRVGQIYSRTGADSVVMDMTGVGSGFHDDVRREIGRGYTGFNFSDWEEVEKMMGSMNYALHNELVSLPDDTKLKEQLEAIVKQQSYEGSRVRFSGKDYAPEGKDDLAIATIMAAFPPKISGDKSRELQQRDGPANGGDSIEIESEQDSITDGFNGLKISESDSGPGYSTNNTRSKNYSTRYRRNTGRRRSRL